MKNTDVNEFSQVLGATYALYGKDLPDGVRSLWWEALKRYELTEVRGALSAHVRNPDNGQFVPKPADVIRLLEGSGNTRGLQAWSKVERAVKEIGPYETVVFDDPIIHAVLSDMGGWTALGNVLEDEWPFKRNEFVKRYEGFASRPPQTYLPALTGLFEAHNRQEGRKIAPPVLIGDPDKARLTYEGGASQQSRYTTLPDLMSRVALKQEKAS